MTTSQLPADPLGRFREVYDALSAERSWYQGASSLRFSAMTAMCCPGTVREVAGGIRKVAEEIKEESSWFGSLKSELRFIVGAMLLQRGDSAHGFLKEVKRVKQFLRDESVRPRERPGMGSRCRRHRGGMSSSPRAGARL